MEKEFKSLSEKREVWGEDIRNQNTNGVIYWEEDIKEFIKRLKEKLSYEECKCRCEDCLSKEIDKLAGDKLITK